MHAQRSASLTNDELVRRIDIDSVDFAADRQCVSTIHDFPVMVGPVPIMRGVKSLETDRVDIRHSNVRMQRCTEVKRPRSRILDAQLQFEPSAAYRHAQLACEGMGPKFSRVAGVF